MQRGMLWGLTCLLAVKLGEQDKQIQETDLSECCLKVSPVEKKQRSETEKVGTVASEPQGREEREWSFIVRDLPKL